jgi:hypothetical protein
VRQAKLVLVSLWLVASCGGSTPIGPSGGGNNPGPPPPNNLPVIDSIKIQGTRPNEPADFADVGEGVPVIAAVHDDETPADALEYQWSATAGTFSGTGPSVTWQASAGVTTPQDVTITLKVVERYGGANAPFTHEVTGTASLSLHDSVKEVSEMARQFLLDFSDSSIRDVAYIMRNFEPGCYGTADETEQVANNRKHFVINKWFIGDASTTVNFGGVCPFRNRKGDACAAVPVRWDSLFVDDGSRDIVGGTDWIAAFYRTARKSWVLCDSSFDGMKIGPFAQFIR